MKLSIIIPCYNEEKNLPVLLKKLATVIKRNDIEVILVDNGSTDNSKSILDSLLPDYPFASTIRVNVNQGYGYGILTGLKIAQGQFIGWTHADLQTDPHDVIKALDIIEHSDNPDKLFIKGNRKGRNLFDVFFTLGMSFFETFLLRQWLWDINAQPNIFPKKFFQSWQDPPFDFSLDLYALYQAKKNGLSIVRIKVMFPPRIHGTSSWNTGLKGKLKFIKRTLDFSFKLHKGLTK